MTAAAQRSLHQYVYGVVEQDAALPDGLVGVAGEPVRRERLGEVALLLSDLPDPDAFGTPDDIRAHTDVLDTVARSCAVLPMAFATVVEDIEDLAPAVERNQQLYLQDLQRIADAVQMTVRARYVTENVLAELVAENGEIARLRAMIAGTTEEQTYAERIRLGELIVAGLDRKRPADAHKIVAALEPHALDLQARESGQSEDVVELAALVRRGEEQAFDDALEALAERMVDRIRFRLIGPQAPYDFVGEV